MTKGVSLLPYCTQIYTYTYPWVTWPNQGRVGSMEKIVMKLMEVRFKGTRHVHLGAEEMTQPILQRQILVLETNGVLHTGTTTRVPCRLWQCLGVKVILHIQGCLRYRTWQTWETVMGQNDIWKKSEEWQERLSEGIDVFTVLRIWEAWPSRRAISG